MSEVTRVLVVVGGKSVDARALSNELDDETEVEIKVIAPALSAAAPAPAAAASDPLAAIEDALASFDADQILLVPHAPDRQTWTEEGLLEEARERFTVPIRELQG